MNIYINNKPQETEEHICLTDVLSPLHVTSSQKGIAIAVNHNVIPRAEWDMYELKAGDQVTIIKATQGG